MSDLRRKAHEALKDLVRLCEDKMSVEPDGFYIQVAEIHTAIDAAIDAAYAAGKKDEELERDFDTQVRLIDAAEYDLGTLRAVAAMEALSRIRAALEEALQYVERHKERCRFD